MAEQVLGLGPRPFVAAPMAPLRLPEFRGDDGANARALVDVMTGRPKSLNVSDGFDLVFAALGKDRANADLISELYTLKERIQQRLAEQRTARLSALEAKHEQIYLDCRAKLDEKTALINELGRLQSLANAGREKLSRYRLAVMATESREPLAETFPTRAERSAWHDEVAQARAALSKVEREYTDVMGLVGETDAQLRAADKQLDQLMGEESRLQAQVEGRPWRTELGIEVRPEAD
jgi:hypothetical protein